MCVCICVVDTGVNSTMGNPGSSKMFKKVRTEFKAAVMIIVNEDIAALRGFYRSFMNSIFKSAPKGHNTRR